MSTRERADKLLSWVIQGQVGSWTKDNIAAELKELLPLIGDEDFIERAKRALSKRGY